MENRDDSGSIAVATPPATATEIATVPRRSPRRKAFILAGIGLLAVILVVAGALGSASLSQTYSARQAVLDYFGALAHRDADGMLANASFQRGEGSYSVFFTKAAIQGMLRLPANSDVRNVRITADRPIDGSSRSLTVAMTWNGNQRSETLTVRQDLSQSRWLFFHPWRAEIPSTLIQVTLPNQPGDVYLDGIQTTSAGRTAIRAIPGIHRVSMDSTDIWDNTSRDVNGIDSPATVTLDGTIKASALDDARQAVKDGFNNCDAAKYDGCFNHTYSAPDSNFIYYFKLTGYGNVSYARYVDTLRDDPTADMKLTVQADTGKIAVNGTCRETITVDGSRRYTMKGDWSGTLTLSGGAISSDLTWDCEQQRG
jgi:hypothetical protein